MRGVVTSNFSETKRLAWVLILMALLFTSPTVVVAGAAEDANAVIERWSAAYSSNDPEAVVIGRMPFFLEP